MVDILNVVCVENALDVLQGNQQAIFGKFTPQHMVEHLLFTLEISVGKYKQELVSKEEQREALRAFLYSEKELRFGAKAPFLTDELPPLVYSNLEEAIMKLKETLTHFFDYYEHSTDQHTHPVFGLLNREEWIMFHNKHFTHHFKQFGLV